SAVLAALVAAGGAVRASEARFADQLKPVTAPAEAVTVVQGLEHPWALAFLPDDSGILITERPGRLRLWRDGQLSDPLEGVPQIYARNQGGLLDVVLSPYFERDRRVYLGYAEQGDQGSAGT